MELPITWRFIGALLLILFALTADVAHAAIGRTPGAAAVSPSGEAVYSIPLKLPPGTNGMTPALSFEYRHRSVVGLLGVGWNIGGLSQIARCPRTLAQDGVLPPIAGTGNDRFCLDGQRLVVINGVAYGAPGAEYRTEIESFARIRSYTGTGSGPQYFTVEAQDGRTFEYGATVDSRIDSSDGIVNTNYGARTWALNRIRDRSGNVIDFEYLEDFANVTFRITAIRYNSNPDAGIPASHQIVFTYENRPNNEVDIAYVAGMGIRQVVRLDRIDVLYNNSILRRYELSYEPALSAGRRSRLASIQECGAGGSECLAATRFTWQDATPGYEADKSFAAMIGITPTPVDHKWTMADINGDGIGDYVWSEKTLTGPATLRFRLGLAGNSLGPEVSTDIQTFYGIGVPFDHNGDGRTDLLMLSADRQWTVLPGSANGFGPPLNSGLTPGPQIPDYRGLDMNGDGLGDLAWSEILGNTGNSLVVRLRYALPGGGFSANAVTLYEQAYAVGYDTPQGGRFLGVPGRHIDLNGDGGEDLLMNENYTVARITATAHATDYFEGSFYGAAVADINGDGCTDFAYGRASVYMRVRVSPCSVYWSGPELLGPVSLGGWVVAHDWNNDGRDDLLFSGPTNWLVSLSNGDSLAPAVDTGIPRKVDGMMVSGDSNGDGLADLITYNDGVIAQRIRNGSRQDVLLSATDGYGVTATFNYRPLSDASVYKRGSGAIFPIQDQQSSAYVVAELSTTDGTGLGSMTTTRYSYEGLRGHVQGRGTLGFAARTSVSTSSGVETRVEETRRQDFPYTGLPASIVVRQASGDPISETSYTWTKLNLGSGVALRRFPYALSTVQRNYEVGGTYDGAQTSTTTRKVAAIDVTSGLVTDETTTITEIAGGGNAGSSSSLRTYQTSVLNDAANWCMGRAQNLQLIASHSLTGGAALTRNFSQTWDGLKCRPTQQRIEPGDSQWQVTFGLAYDSFGNPVSRSITGIGMGARITRFDWGSRGQFPVSMTNALSQTTTLAWDYSNGLPIAMTDPNALTVNWSYDSFGRPTQETRPDKTVSQWSRAACAAGCDSRTRYQLLHEEKDSTGNTQGMTIIDVDQLGRGFRAATRQPGGGMTMIAADSDTRGRTARQYVPFWSGGAPGAYWQFDYDAIDRPVGATLRSSSGAANRAVVWRYDGHVVAQTDPLGHVTTETRSAWGKLLRIGDAAGGNTEYEYDAFGRLLQVRDALNNVTGTITYNARGMKLAQNDADMGNWTYTRNALGEIVSLRDAKLQDSTFTYDKLGRPTGRVTPEGANTWTWGGSATYHNVGRLAAITGPGYSESLKYDAYARPTIRTITTDAIYRYDYAYNSLGLLDSLTYPATGVGARFKLGYEYESGQLARIKDANAPANSFWRLNTLDAAGNIIDETLGSAIRVVSGFDPDSGAIDYRQSGVGGGSAIQDLAYAWDANYNLTRREDRKRAVVEDFRYDTLDRLDDVRRNGAISLALDYDAIGNVTWKSDVCPTAVPCFAYHSGKKHAVVSAGGRTYDYDANGNMTNRGGASISWTSDNLPITITGASGNSSQFSYGPAGNRWKQLASHAGTIETTIYAGELMEKVTRAGVTAWRHYILAPTGTVALQLRYSDGTAAATHYLTHDYLGSTDKLLDANGNTLVAESFGAFGARRGANWSGAPSAADLATISANTRDGFTGHEHLDNLNLIHMNGRVYDPRIGRFTSADPYVPEPFSAQSFNRYAYVLNNPLSYVDPSGFDEEVPCVVAPSGACAQITLIGARWADAASYFGGYSPQVESATQRDPCGQDSTALACAMQGRTSSPASVVLTVGTRADPTLSGSTAADFLQGAAARLGNLAFNAAPITWLFDSNMDFEWFDVPDSMAGSNGATLGDIGYLLGGAAGIVRQGGVELAATAPSRIARTFQGTKNYPGVDRFRDIMLKKDTIIFSGYPGQSAFYTTSSALRRSGGSAAKLFDGLQVRFHELHGYRSRIAAYEVLYDTPAAMALAIANGKHGSGWLPQVFVPSFETTLRRLSDFPLDP